MQINVTYHSVNYVVKKKTSQNKSSNYGQQNYIYYNGLIQRGLEKVKFGNNLTAARAFLCSIRFAGQFRPMDYRRLREKLNHAFYELKKAEFKQRNTKGR